MTKYDLEDAVMMLHHAARIAEREFGFNGALSNDIRKCADRLTDMIKAEIHTEK